MFYLVINDHEILVPSAVAIPFLAHFNGLGFLVEVPSKNNDRVIYYYLHTDSDDLIYLGLSEDID